ncbi:MAG: MFS transporter, partial [Streptococcus mitis]|nr:MFS transporter [Streptococcus mitis]
MEIRTSFLLRYSPCLREVGKMTEINWKDNLRIAWFGNFLTGAS